MACQNRSNLPQAPFYHFSGQRMVPLTESLAVVLTFPKSRSTINFMGFNCDISHWCLQIYIYIYNTSKETKLITAPFRPHKNNVFTKMLRLFGYFIFYYYFLNQVRSQLYSFRPPKLYDFSQKMRAPTWKHLHPSPHLSLLSFMGSLLHGPQQGSQMTRAQLLGKEVPTPVNESCGFHITWGVDTLRPTFFRLQNGGAKNCCGEWFGWLCIFFFGKKKKRLGWNWMVNIVFGNFWRHVFFTIYTKKRSPDPSDEFQGICNVYQPVINPSLDKKHGDFWLRSLRLILLLDSAENDCIGLDFQQKIHKIQIRDTFQSLKIHWSPLRTRDLERVFPFNFSPFCFPTFLQK